MMMSTPFFLCCTACLTLPHSAATSRPEAWMRSMISFGGVPSALAISLTFGRFRASSSSGVAVASVQPSRPSLSLLSGHSGTPCSRSSFAAKSWCSCGTMACSCFSSSSGSTLPMPSYFCGITMSTA